MQISKTNNFDLIRLVAAIQVVLIHSYKLLHIPSEAFNVVCKSFIDYFPGVPIFFTISGFLIYWSFERNTSAWKTFAKNRLLRIYPGLWISFAITLILLFGFGILNFQSIRQSTFWAWVIAQVSFLQFWNPDALLGSYGTGAPNGSLWTITVELQFYLAIPFIYYFVQKVRRTNLALGIIATLSYLINLYAQTLDKTDTIRVLMNVCVLPYLFYFVAGIFIFKNYEKLHTYLIGKFLWWIFGYYAYFLIFSVGLNTYEVAENTYFPNLICLGGYLILSMATISAAVTAPSLSHKLLKGNDISYGYYVYHMVIINVLVHIGFIGHFYILFIVLGLTAVLAYFSWVFIERPALQLKNKF